MNAVAACPRGFPAEAAGSAAGPQPRWPRTRPTRRRWGGRRPRRQRHLCVVGGVRQQPLPAASATACQAAAAAASVGRHAAYLAEKRLAGETFGGRVINLALRAALAAARSNFPELITPVEVCSTTLPPSAASATPPAARA